MTLYWVPFSEVIKMCSHLVDKISIFFVVCMPSPNAAQTQLACGNWLLHFNVCPMHFEGKKEFNFMDGGTCGDVSKARLNIMRPNVNCTLFIPF